MRWICTSPPSSSYATPGGTLANPLPSRATISLYQRLALPPTGLEEAQGPWYHAIQRCLDACDSLTATLRTVSDTHLENLSPLVISPIFASSRFFLVHAKLLSVEIPRNLDLLVYALKTCGLRWPYARRLEKVIRTATAEHRLPREMSSLPTQFYDLQYSYLDVDEALRVWAEGLEPWMHLAGLEHPALDQGGILMGAGLGIGIGQDFGEAGEAVVGTSR